MPTDIRPLVRKLKIVDKNAGIQTLGDVMTPMQERILQSVQEDLWAGRMVRKRILKARQMGCSTVVEAIIFIMAFLRPRTRGLVISKDTTSAEHLLSMNTTYWEQFFAAEAYTQKFKATNKLGWEETKSLITVKTAKDLEGARSMTIHALHASEAAFWPDPKRLITGLGPAIPKTPTSMIFQESTANGVGNWWHEVCSDPDDGYDFLFFGWWEHPEYVASQIGHAELLRIPLIFNSDEERLLDKFLRKKGLGSEEIHDRLIWRRLTLAEHQGDIDYFHQEYPTTKEEAFVATGNNVFQIEYLRNVCELEHGTTGELIPDRREGVRFIPDPPNTLTPGPLRVFRYPGSKHDAPYIIGGDPAWTGVGDFACAQVLNRDTWEQVAVFRQKMDAATFGEQMVLLGRWYNNALLVPESTKAGGATVATIRARGYDNLFIHTKQAAVQGQPDQMYGWATMEQTKHEIVSNMKKALYDANLPEAQARGIGILIHDQQTYKEMKEFVADQKRGTYGNSANTSHDDCVMALCIALTAHLHSVNELPPRYSEPGYDRAPRPAAANPVAEVMQDLGVQVAPMMESETEYYAAPTYEHQPDDDMFGPSEWND